MAAPSVFTHDILPRIQAGHHVLSIVTHEWERVQNMLLDAGDVLNRRLLKWTSSNPKIMELKDVDGYEKWVNLFLLLSLGQLLVHNFRLF